MALISKALATSLGLGAALSFAATPASAAELPVADQSPIMFEITGDFDAEEANVNHHRGYRRYGRYRHRNRVRAGDVIAGIAIIGGIAAIANATSNNKRRDRDVRSRDRDYQPQRRSDTRGAAGSRGLQSAVSQCVSSIERDVRVENVDNVSRTAAGWQVNGTIYNGDSFACRIGQDGRIESVDYGGQFSASPASASPRQAEDRQWSADRYAAAWDKVERDEALQTRPAQEQAATSYGEPRYTPEQTQQRAAYPGGPVEGESLDNRPEAPAASRVAQAANTRR